MGRRLGCLRGHVARRLQQGDEEEEKQDLWQEDHHRADPCEQAVRDELAAYGNGLDEKPEIVALSKVDALDEKARAAFTPSLNKLAVHCHQTRGGQYIDVGFVDIKERTMEK